MNKKKFSYGRKRGRPKKINLDEYDAQVLKMLQWAQMKPLTQVVK